MPTLRSTLPQASLAVTEGGPHNDSLGGLALLALKKFTLQYARHINKESYRCTYIPAPLGCTPPHPKPRKGGGGSLVTT